MMKHWYIVSASSVALWFTTGVGADVINLRTAVRLESSASIVRLSDIAELEGPVAASFADLEVATVAKDGVREISVLEIRAKLDEVGVHWGRVSLNGRTVTIRSARDPSISPPMAMTATTIDDEETRPHAQKATEEYIAATLIEQATIRSVVASVVASGLGVRANDLKMKFMRGDGAWLDDAAHTARVEVQPLSHWASDRIELNVRLWRDGQVRETRAVAVVPLVRCRAAVLSQDAARYDMLREQDVLESEQWLSPVQSREVVSRVAAVGRVATKEIKAGEVVREKCLQRNVLIKRGDLTTVRCLVGGAVITLQAEARSEGAEGDTIEFRKPGERDTFRATITGRGEAVLDLGRKHAHVPQRDSVTEQG